ncbi:non-ribosomal peptide synthetase [Flavilitoribacter nigricans]|uniref:Carrier domain-containing protein n=1 Tax=Flavilitoribacter nigricans (strain ATCC 23147 / DSM 23189 / NBRC 102662 / NCIMB 1420 / SS-2) TaxID=1122177 RepID=A0A2D0NJP4_FLAN2|nr:non-ribosomal peptide synthetase [Flavilitoribacter nigricans]PHN08610.1 hypothetical protein CRP01_01475 [Flavilitoribacter nigricans DSM 23189 = NBRC 102662]
MNEFATTPHSSSGALPLTSSQYLIWMGQSLYPDRPLYNMAMCFEIAGALDVDRFRRAFRELVRQNDAMRMVFEERNGEPRQILQDHIDFELDYLDWSGRDTTEKQLKEWAARRSRVNFDLGERLFDAALIKLSPEKYVWFFNEHHLIIDAWAMTLQYRALAGYYHALGDEAQPEPEALPAFREYVREQIETREQTAKSSAAAHWCNKANTLARAPAFYGRDKRMVDTASQRISLDLGPERMAALQELARRPELRSWTLHTSLFNIFASLLAAFTYRVSGQQELAIGTPAHNRTSPQQKNIPGLFIELFPLAVSLGPDETFLSLFKKMQEETNSFLKNARAGTSTPELSRAYNVVLNYINASFPDFNGMPMRLDWVHPDHADPAHHLRLQVHDFDQRGTIQLHFDLNTDIFDQELRTELPAHFLRLLDQFLANPAAPIAETALVEGNGEISVPDSEVIVPDTVLTTFEKIVGQYPGEMAVATESQSITYRDLDQRSNQLARFLLDNGLEKGDRVALLLRRSPELIISIWAVLKAGGTFVPVPVHTPAGRALGIIHDADARLVLSTSDLIDHLEMADRNIIRLDVEQAFIAGLPADKPQVTLSGRDLAYLIYTSGSTGLPKGVMLSHAALAHYIQWAGSTYVEQEVPVMPLFTSIGFDLTITSLFLPLLTGGTIIPFPETDSPADLALLDVLRDDRINLIKLTPSHLGMIDGEEYAASRIRTMIVGGEFFKTSLALAVSRQFGNQIRIFNEYGPTEATVGCVVHEFDRGQDEEYRAVPIGLPIARMPVFILDEYQHPVPNGVAGELYIGGRGLAEGYWGQDDLTAEKFIRIPALTDGRLYRSGDLVRMNRSGQLEYIGRKDEQVKIGGRRVELEEISSALSRHPAIGNAVVSLRSRRTQAAKVADHNCVRCGLPANYPTAEFDEQGVCHLCRSFQHYQENVQKYFRTMADLKALFTEKPGSADRAYDCIMLLSGGKDSTYALGQLVELGLNVLAFTLDNGYISQQAKDNISRVVQELGVDHVFGETPVMNEIFVDSLQRHCNVCDGCFKTIYTLSIQLALEKNIPYIVTGLSRGQFFETRLTEELFRKERFDADEIDNIILQARKAYHRVDDAVRELMDVSMFADDTVFERVQFVDFYRYTDVSLEEMLNYLDQRLPWVRPTDTGRSTNCLINQAGIFVHKKEKGYSNYAFPYSWDVRIGHKTREASLEEINETIDEVEVQKILDEIGYTEARKSADETGQLIAYYSAPASIDTYELRDFLASRMPDYMIPVQFIRMDRLPVTSNGKVDKEALPEPDHIRPSLKIEYVAPRSDMEELLSEIWTDILGLDRVGVFDNFIDIGGDSLSGIRLMARINEMLELELPINLIFEKTTIASLATAIEARIQTLLAAMDRAE